MSELKSEIHNKLLRQRQLLYSVMAIKGIPAKNTIVLIVSIDIDRLVL